MIGQLQLFELPRPAGDRHCVDCGLDTLEAGEYYMVHDETWPLEELGMLCIGCLEERIGRRLTPADFTDALINLADGCSSERLRSSRRSP